LVFRYFAPVLKDKNKVVVYRTVSRPRIIRKSVFVSNRNVIAIKIAELFVASYSFLEIRCRMMHMHTADIKLMILVTNKGSAPSFINGARIITSKKLVYPSTGGSCGFQVIPNPFARFFAYL
jgi:hypothetical protein